MQNPKGFAHRAERQDQEVPGARQPVVIDPGSAQGRRQRREEKRDVVLEPGIHVGADLGAKARRVSRMRATRCVRS